MRCFLTIGLCLGLAACQPKTQAPSYAVRVEGGTGRVQIKFVDVPMVVEALTAVGAHADLSVAVPEDSYREFFEAAGAVEKLEIPAGMALELHQAPRMPFVVAFDDSRFWLLPVSKTASGGFVLGNHSEGGQEVLHQFSSQPAIAGMLASRFRTESERALAGQDFNRARRLAQNARVYSEPDKAVELLKTINAKQGEALLARGESERRAKDYAAARATAEEAGEFLPVAEREEVTALFQRILEDEGGELRALPGHKGAVTALAYSPDGKWIASAGEDRAVILWNASSGKVERTLLGHRLAVRSVRFSADGKKLISGGDDGTIRLWEVESGREIQLFDDRGWQIRSVDLSRNGQWAISGGEDHHVKLWSVATGKQVKSLSGHDWKVTAAEFLPDENLAVTASDDDTLKIWDLRGAAEIRTMRDGFSPVKSLCLSRDGRMMLSGCEDHSIKVWETTGGKLTGQLSGHEKAVVGVALSPDEKLAASASPDGTVRLWQLDGSREIRRFTAGSQPALAVAYSPDGRIIVSGGVDGVLTQWQLPRDVWPALETAQE